MNKRKENKQKPSTLFWDMNLLIKYSNLLYNVEIYIKCKHNFKLTVIHSNKTERLLSSIILIG